VRRFVIDASVAIKWIAAEDDSDLARALQGDSFLAPDLISCELANILWKKVARGHLTAKQAMLAVGMINDTALDIQPSEPLMARATELTIALNHPAYDCFYLALAEREGCALVTADERLQNKLAGWPGAPILSLAQAVAG
jgi:predicted nucleic acid-binding protein